MDRQQLVLIAPPPMRPGAWVTEERLPGASAALIAAYQALAARLDVRFVDTAGWNIDLTFDGVHFSENGHRTFARRLYQALQ